MSDYKLKPVYRNKRRKGVLYFEDNTKRGMMRNRYDLAKRIIKEKICWVRTTAEEAGAVASLVKWGMLERWPTDERTVRWAEHHSKPIFRSDIEPLCAMFVRGRLVTRLTKEQAEMLASLEKSGGIVVIEGHGKKDLQRSLRSLQRRGLVWVKHGSYQEAPWHVQLQGDTLPVTDVIRLELMIAGPMLYDDLLDVLVRRYPQAASSQWKEAVTTAVNRGELMYLKIPKGAGFEMRLKIG